MEVLPDGEQFVGTRGGGMDHAAVLGSRAGCASLISFRPVAIRHIPIPREWAFLVAHSRRARGKVRRHSRALQRHSRGGDGVGRPGARSRAQRVRPCSRCGGRHGAGSAGALRADSAGVARFPARPASGERSRVGPSGGGRDGIGRAGRAAYRSGLRRLRRHLLRARRAIVGARRVWWNASMRATQAT